jgi:hypothetical protein
MKSVALNVGAEGAFGRYEIVVNHLIDYATEVYAGFGEVVTHYQQMIAK